MRPAALLIAALGLGSCELATGQGRSIEYRESPCPAYGRPADPPNDRDCYSFEAVGGERVEASCLGTDLIHDPDPGCAVFIGPMNSDSFDAFAESAHGRATIGYTTPRTGDYIVEAWYQRQGFFFEEEFSLVRLSLPSCVEDRNALCLGGWRFRVTADWETPDGTSGHGNAVAVTGDSGFFWFFDASNLEVVVKVHDGCELNEKWWVFAGGLTNVLVTVKVTDTVTGESQTYVNSLGIAFEPVQDTVAFPCP